jgi:CRP/FNR family cyclic AMP-dependent transcriptional regulator
LSQVNTAVKVAFQNRWFSTGSSPEAGVDDVPIIGPRRKNMTQTASRSLAEHPFVAGLQPQHAVRLTAMATPVRFDAGQVIFREGDDYSVLYLLEEGMLALELEVPGHLLRVQTLHGGDVFDWSALLPHSAKHFQARALEPVSALAFEGEALLASFERDPAFGLDFMLRLMGVVSERLRATRMQLLDMYSPVAKRAGT